MIAAPFLVSSQFLGSKVDPRSRRPPLHRQAPRCHAATATATATAVSPSPSSSSSLYDVLGLPSGATCWEIKAAYRRLARTCHPDVVAADRRVASTDEFIRIHAAYATLSDAGKRADYDRRLMGPGRQCWSVRPAPPASPSFSGYARRTWETDQCW